MKRKVVQHGAKTLTISLPAEWAKRNNIKVGDELDVVDKVTKLEIEKEHQHISKEIDLDIKTINPHIVKRLLGNLYRKGYSQITLRFVNEKIKEGSDALIAQLLDMCIGLEIVEETKNKVLIKTVASVEHESYDVAFRRYFLLSIQVTEKFLEVLSSGVFQDMDKVLALEQKQNTLYLYCSRILFTTNHLSREELLHYYLLVERLEETCDEYRDMAIHVKKNKSSRISKQFISLVEQSIVFLRQIYDLYYAFDEKKIPAITEKRSEADTLKMLYLNQKSKTDPVLLHHIFIAFVKIYEASSPIVGIKLGGLEKEQKLLR